jgi:hypothetical protein
MTSTHEQEQPNLVRYEPLLAYRIDKDDFYPAEGDPWGDLQNPVWRAVNWERVEQRLEFAMRLPAPDLEPAEVEPIKSVLSVAEKTQDSTEHGGISISETLTDDVPTNVSKEAEEIKAIPEPVPEVPKEAAKLDDVTTTAPEAILKPEPEVKAEAPAP